MLNLTLKVIAHSLKSLKFCSENVFPFVFPFLSYLSSFLIKMHATEVKTQKIEPELFFMTDKIFGGSV